MKHHGSLPLPSGLIRPHQTESKEEERSESEQRTECERKIRERKAVNTQRQMKKSDKEKCWEQGAS